MLYLRGCSGFAIRITLRDIARSCNVQVARLAKRGCGWGKGVGMGVGTGRQAAWSWASAQAGRRVGVGEGTGRQAVVFFLVVFFSGWSFFLFVHVFFLPWQPWQHLFILFNCGVGILYLWWVLCTTIAK